jgi:metal-responsive CopG/Arc/MetJ family transcriptional regulator
MKKPRRDKFAVVLHDDILEAIQKAAATRYMSRSEFIRQAVIEKLERERDRQKVAA